MDQLEELRRVGSKVEAMLEEGEAGGGARSMGHAKLLHSVWLKLHPESQETEESLAEVIVLHHHGKELSIISFSGTCCRQTTSDPGKCQQTRQEKDRDSTSYSAGECHGFHRNGLTNFNVALR